MSVLQSGKPQHGASRLNGFNDLFGGVASEGEPRRVTVQLHRAPKSLLSGLRHAVRLVENNDLVPAFGQSDLLLGKHLDPVGQKTFVINFNAKNLF